VSIWYDNNEINLEKIERAVEYFRTSRHKKEMQILNRNTKSFFSFIDFIGTSHSLCSGLLYLRRFDEIMEIRKKAAEFSFLGQEQYGFTARYSKFMLHDAVLSRDEKYYLSICKCINKLNIKDDFEDRKQYGLYSIHSIIKVIQNETQRAIKYLKNFQIAEDAIKSGRSGGGEAQGLLGIFKKDKNKIIKGVINLLDNRLRNYKRLKQLPIDDEGIASYLLFLARDKEIEIDVTNEIPEKYHIIIPDVLNID
jgi:hypothetical protein